MSSYVLMKILESAPERYDRGIALLSRGRIAAAYEEIARRVARPEARVLDVGCGTGGAALACARRGAHVVAVDVNAGMLDVARRKADAAGLGHAIEWFEMAGAELDRHFPPESFDAAVSCLALSEMSATERAFVLAALRRLVRPGGRVVIVDETIPRGRWRRQSWRLARVPLVVMAWLLTQNTTRALEDPAGDLRRAGFLDVSQRDLGGSLRLAEGTVGKDRS